MIKSETVKLTAYDRRRAEKFATLRCGDVALYEKRGGFKRDDVLAGALGEIAVYKLLREHGKKVSKPDFAIYKGRQKSYSADLQDEKCHYHVKSQSLSSKKKYGSSWLMQREDKLLTRPHKGHYIVPTTVDLETNKVEIHLFGNVETIKTKNLIGECKVHWFQKYKVALYLAPLAELSHSSRWGVLKR